MGVLRRPLRIVGVAAALGRERGGRRDGRGLGLVEGVAASATAREVSHRTSKARTERSECCAMHRGVGFRVPEQQFEA